MARTCAVQPDTEATIRSPRSALRWPKRGLALTARAMHSVADRISGCIAALFCSMDKFGECLGSTVGPVADATTSAAAASGARIMRGFPLRHRQLSDVRGRAHLKTGPGGTRRPRAALTTVPASGA